jgi:hypothetical protein
VEIKATSVTATPPGVVRAAAVLCLIAASSWAALAAAAADYKARIDASREIVDALLLEPDGLDSDAARAGLASVRRNIPATERVEWSGGSVETNNNWLTQNFAAFEGAKQDSGRVAALTEMSERLAALSIVTGERLEAEKAAPTKDAEKQKLNEILNREEYQKPKAVEESLFQRWYRQILEWLTRSVPDAETTPGTAADFSAFRTILQVLIFTVAAGLIGFLIYRLVPVLSRRFSSREKREREDRVIFGERIADDQSSGDLFREAERLAAAGDLRAAIRKGYVALLCDLSDRRILRLSRHKTNRDYLRDTRSHDDIYKSVRRLTDTFETNWYGLRATEQADWEAFKNNYEEAVAAAGRK